jgi:hypothetical protein
VTLADHITGLLRTAGVTRTNPRALAVRLINDVRAHDHANAQADTPAVPATPITWRRPPFDDCPSGCVVGAEWHRQAIAARDEIQQLRSDVLHAQREVHRG